MQSKKKVIIPLIIAIATIVVIIVGSVIFYNIFSTTAYNTDVAHLNSGERPLHVRQWDVCNDGGTKIYRGLGYHIVEWSSFIENAHLKNEDIEKALENSNLTREEYEELAGTKRVYVCGWDIARGYDYGSTVRNHPGFEHTINLHFEFDKLK